MTISDQQTNKELMANVDRLEDLATKAMIAAGASVGTGKVAEARELVKSTKKALKAAKAEKYAWVKAQDPLGKRSTSNQQR